MVALLQPTTDPLRLRPPAATGRSARHLRVVPDSSAVRVSSLTPGAIALAAVAAVLMVLVLGVRLAQGTPPTASLEPVTLTPSVATSNETIVVVAPGQTLWSIASELSGSDDPRPIVAALAERNGGSSLQAGQRLIIPADVGVHSEPLLLAVGE